MTETALPAMPLAPDSFWSRLCTTPIREALRGQLTGSLDVRRVIAAADLPDPLPSLTYQTVCRTKLRRSMRLEAARELISRFRGDLIAGRAPDDIVVSFGDPLDVARTIHHEKRLVSTWRRLTKTPLRDVLRGRLTGSLDLHRAIAGAALPPSLSDVILLVVRRTRLWRRRARRCSPRTGRTFPRRPRRWWYATTIDSVIRRSPAGRTSDPQGETPPPPPAVAGVSACSAGGRRAYRVRGLGLRLLLASLYLREADHCTQLWIGPYCAGTSRAGS